MTSIHHCLILLFLSQLSRGQFDCYPPQDVYGRLNNPDCVRGRCFKSGGEFYVQCNAGYQPEDRNVSWRCVEGRWVKGTICLSTAKARGINLHYTQDYQTLLANFLYNDDLFDNARVIVRHSRSGESYQKNIAKKINLSLRTSLIPQFIPVGTVIFSVEILTNGVVSSSAETTIATKPPQPHNIQVISGVDNLKITWDVALGLESYLTFAIHCMSLDSCQGISTERTKRGELEWFSGNKLRSGYKLKLSTQAIYYDVVNELKSEAKQFEAYTEVRPVKELQARYIQVASTAQIHTTDFSVTIAMYNASAGYFSKVEMKVEQLNRRSRRTKLVVTTEYVAGNFVQERITATIDLSYSKLQAVHPVPGGLYKLTATVLGLPGKSSTPSTKHIAVPPHPPIRLVLSSAPGAPLLSFVWVLSDISIQDRLILKLCWQTEEDNCREVLINPLKQIYTFKHPVTPGNYKVRLLAQSVGLNSSLSQPLAVTVGNYCTIPEGINGYMVSEDEPNTEIYYFTSDQFYVVKCLEGFHAGRPAKNWFCNEGSWVPGSKCFALVNVGFVLGWTLFGLLAVAGSVAAVIYYRRKQKQKQKEEEEEMAARKESGAKTRLLEKIQSYSRMSLMRGKSFTVQSQVQASHSLGKSSYAGFNPPLMGNYSQASLRNSTLSHIFPVRKEMVLASETSEREPVDNYGTLEQSKLNMVMSRSSLRNYTRPTRIYPSLLASQTYGPQSHPNNIYE